MAKKKEIIQLMACHVFENKKYPGGRFVSCDMLEYPLLNSKEYETADFKDYIWESRQFEYPVFTHKKVGEFFVMEMKISKNEFSCRIVEDEKLLAKAKDTFAKWQVHHEAEWKRITEKWKDIPLNKNIKI